MKTDTNLKLKIETTTVKFQKLIIERLKLFDFSRSAITAYCENRNRNLEGYDFNTFKDKFKLSKFKPNSEIKKIKYNEIIGVGNVFIESELSDAIFVLNISSLEQWILSIMRIILTKNPIILRHSDKQIDLTLVQESEDIDDLWGKIIERYLLALPYSGTKNMLNKAIKTINIDQTKITPNIIDRINEYSQCRHLIIHNNKTVNQVYVRKSGKFARYNVGDTIKIDEKTLFEEGDTLLRFMQDIRKCIN